MNADALIDAMQTAALVVSMMAQIYTMRLISHEMRGAANGLRQVLDGQSEIMRSIERLWTHVNRVEVRLGIFRPHDDGKSPRDDDRNDRS